MFTNHQLQSNRQLEDNHTSDRTAGTSKHLPPNGACRHTFSYIITFKVTLLVSAALNCFEFPHSRVIITMYRNLSLVSSTDSDVFYVERSSAENSPIRKNTPVIFNSTELSGAMKRNTITFSSVASPEPQIVAIESDSNEPTFPYAFGTQHPKVPPSLNDLNLPHNPFNVLATLAVMQQDQEESPQSPEPSDPSPISTPPMHLSTIEECETPHTTTDDNTFYSSENEPRRVYWDLSPDETVDSNEPRRVSPAESPSSTPPPPPRQKRRLSMGMFFPQKGGVSQHICEACGQPLPDRKTP